MVVGFQGETREVGELFVREEVEMVGKQLLWNLVPKDDDGKVPRELRGVPPRNFEVFQICEGKIEVVEEVVDRHGGGCSLYVESAHPMCVGSKETNSLFQPRGPLSRPLHVEHYTDGEGFGTTQEFSGLLWGLIALYTQENIRPQRGVSQSRLPPCVAYLGKSQRGLSGLFWSLTCVNGELEYWSKGAQGKRVGQRRFLHSDCNI